MPSARSTFDTSVISVMVAFALSSCSAEDGSRSAAEPRGAPSTQSGSTTARTVATSASVPRVSYEAICPDLIAHGTAGADLVTEFVTDPQALADKGVATTARFDDVIDDFEYDLEAAPKALVPFLEEQIATLAELRDYLKVGGSRNTDFRKFRSAGMEVVSQCKPYL